MNLKVKWGILSTASIGTEHVIPAMMHGKYCDIKAIASRSIDSARKVAERFSIPKAYGSYDELLRDDEIEAVYIPLPNHLHVPWSIKALQAGKHVLVEKPVGLSSQEGQRLLDESCKYPEFKTDTLATAILEFEKGTSSFFSSTLMPDNQQVEIFGAKGRIELEIPFTPIADKPAKIWLYHEEQKEEIVFNSCDQYTIQGNLFSLAILNDSLVPTPLKDAVDNMKVIERLFNDS